MAGPGGQMGGQPGARGGGRGGRAGGRGGGGGGGGQQAGQILTALAGAMAAIGAAYFASNAQIKSAEIQADADKFIAEKSASTSITQTKMQAETTKKLSENQLRMAEDNKNTTLALAKEQREQSKEDLDRKMEFLKERQDKADAQQERIRKLEEERSQKQIALAKEQADQNLKLAKMNMNIQLMQQGLVTGSGNSVGRSQLASNTIPQQQDSPDANTLTSASAFGVQKSQTVGQASLKRGTSLNQQPSALGSEAKISRRGVATTTPKAPQTFLGVLRSKKDQPQEDLQVRELSQSSQALTQNAYYGSSVSTHHKSGISPLSFSFEETKVTSLQDTPHLSQRKRVQPGYKKITSGSSPQHRFRLIQ